jgi:hypothetical protein
LKSFINYIILKKVSAGLFLLTLSFSLLGQNTFNVRYGMPHSAISTGVFENHEGYLVFGGRTDTTFAEHSDIFIQQLDFSGNEQWTKYFGSAERPLQTRRHGVSRFLDGTFVSASKSHYDDLDHIVLVWFDEFGDSTRTKTWLSPSFENGDPEDFVGMVQFATDLQDNIYVVMSISQEDTGEDYIVRKLSKEGEILWDYWRETERQTERLFGLMVTEDQTVVTSASGILGADLELWLEFISEEGSLIKQVAPQFPHWVNIARDLIPSHNLGRIIGCSSTQVPIVGSALPVVYELDTTGFATWVSFPDDSTDIWHTFRTITPTCDSAYVAAAKFHVVEDTPYNQWLGWVVKFSKDGDILWSRKFQLVDTQGFTHEISKIIETSDNGLLFCGEARDDYWPDWDSTTVSQQSWIVKLDACGCLVPGCDPDCDPPECPEIVDVPDTDYFLYGPNPFHQFLNIYVGDKLDLDAGDVSFKVHDSVGRLVGDFRMSSLETTFMWDLSELPSGQFVLSMMQNDRVLQSEVVVKS